jgi:hypothetical protein
LLLRTQPQIPTTFLIPCHVLVSHRRVGNAHRDDVLLVALAAAGKHQWEESSTRMSFTLSDCHLAKFRDLMIGATDGAAIGYKENP